MGMGDRGLSVTILLYCKGSVATVLYSTVAQVRQWFHKFVQMVFLRILFAFNFETSTLCCRFSI